MSSVRIRSVIILLLGALTALPAAAYPASQPGSVEEAAERLKPGEFIWAPDVAPRGPLMMIVSLATQRATLYRNGVPIAITTVSTGKAGHETPTGVFTILQRQVEHHSNLYDDAPMPYMQRLTWGGVALHGGTLPGYPASHGCIRLPPDFARLLYGVTRLGMTVIVTDLAAVPHAAPSDPLRQSAPMPLDDTPIWTPERSPDGPVSIIVSAADARLLVLRNGIVIGSAPARVEGAIQGTSAFIRSAANDKTWLEVAIPGAIADPAPTGFAGRVRVADSFRALVEPLLLPGTSVVITPDSLRMRSAAPVEILDNGRDPAPPEPG